MTEPIDLDPIRQLADQYAEAGGNYQISLALELAADVPALLAEVERLRAYEAMAAELHAENDRLRAELAAEQEIAASMRAALDKDDADGYQEPCGICTGNGCPDCRDDGPEAGR